MKQQQCGRCHTCGQPLRKVLDGEEWCDTCQTYRRYHSHGWSKAYNGDTDCPNWRLKDGYRREDGSVDYAEMWEDLRPF